MKRTPMPRRRAPLKRRPTPLKRRPTPRLTASHELLSASKAAVRLRDQGRCVVCSEIGREFHHRLPRGMGGASRDPEAHSPSRIILTCRPCHRDCESLRSWATDMGYLVRRGIDKPSAVPLLYRGLWVRLTDDGQVVPLPLWRQA